MVMRCVFKAFLLVVLSSRWCDVAETPRLRRKTLAENQATPLRRTEGGDSVVAEKDLNDMDEDTGFWENRMLTIQSLEDTLSPTATPRNTTTEAPTAEPAFEPTMSPTVATPFPTVSPTEVPTVAPTELPTELPTASPTQIPTVSPTEFPTVSPTEIPTGFPTTVPSSFPTEVPTVSPTTVPDISPPEPFAGILSLQNTVGVCLGSTNGIGCSQSSNANAIGNPNDLVNCFDVTDVGGDAPFSLDGIRFWIGTSIELPPDLGVRVWSSTDGSPDILLQEQSLTGYVIGENTFDLTTPINIESNEFCVGVFSENPMGALRIQNDPTALSEGSESFILAPQCGVGEFSSIEALKLQGSLCIEAFVSR